MYLTQTYSSWYTSTRVCSEEDLSGANAYTYRKAVKHCKLYAQRKSHIKCNEKLIYFFERRDNSGVDLTCPYLIPRDQIKYNLAVFIGKNVLRLK